MTAEERDIEELSYSRGVDRIPNVEADGGVEGPQGLKFPGHPHRTPNPNNYRSSNRLGSTA